MDEPTRTAIAAQSTTACELPVVLHARVVTGRGGGPEKTILNSPRFLEGLGYRGVCAYMHPPGDEGFDELLARAADCDAPVHSVPDRGIRDWRIVRRLLDICRSEKVAIWHGHDYKSNAIGLLLRRYWPMRLVTTVHGWVKFTRRTPLYYWVDRFCLRRYERVVCVSDDLYETCLQSRVPAERCCVIDNAIDTEEFRRRLTTTEARAACGLETERFLIGAVGRLSEEKGFDLLIRATSRLAEEGHDVELAIAGEGDAEPALRELIAAQPEPERFRLLGHRSDIPELFQAMDLFVLSSLREGLPNVLLEAMSLETPVVATRIAGVPKLVADEANGLLVPPGDEEALFGAVRRMVVDHECRETFARAGRGTIEERFSFAARMRRMAALYDELLAESSAREPAR